MDGPEIARVMLKGTICCFLTLLSIAVVMLLTSLLRDRDPGSDMLVQCRLSDSLSEIQRGSCASLK